MTEASVCAWCGEALRQAETGRPAKYCSDAHRKRAYEQRRAIKAMTETTGILSPKMQELGNQLAGQLSPSLQAIGNIVAGQLALSQLGDQVANASGIQSAMEEIQKAAGASMPDVGNIVAGFAPLATMGDLMPELDNVATGLSSLACAGPAMPDVANIAAGLAPLTSAVESLQGATGNLTPTLTASMQALVDQLDTTALPQAVLSLADAYQGIMASSGALRAFEDLQGQIAASWLSEAPGVTWPDAFDDLEEVLEVEDEKAPVDVTPLALCLALIAFLAMQQPGNVPMRALTATIETVTFMLNVGDAIEQRSEVNGLLFWATVLKVVAWAIDRQSKDPPSPD